MMTVEKWWLYTTPMDMRKSIDALTCCIMQEQVSLQKRSAYIFCNRSGTRLKVVLWDGTGFLCCLRRLEKGRFVWPREGTLEEIQSHQFAWLVAGLDWRRWNENLPNPLWI